MQASHELSVERSSYQSFVGSLWSQGVLPQDSLKFMGTHYRPVEIPERYETVQGEAKSCYDLIRECGFEQNLNWNQLRDQVKTGMRNSLCMAIAPTATISNIAGCTQSIEPSYKNLFVKSNLGGEYTVVNEYLIDDLKALKIWNANFARELKRADGSIANFDLPAELKELYQTAFDIEPEQLIRCASARQTYIDQAQSLNLYLAQPSGRRIDEMYRYAWHAGLKTTYYLRSKSASGVEKSSVKSDTQSANTAGGSVTANVMGASAAAQASFAAAMSGNLEMIDSAKACSVENPECESCQ
jgi:ribonucleoside-diphosphate reductase alpha chain